MLKTTVEKLMEEEKVDREVAELLRKGLDKGIVNAKELKMLDNTSELNYFDLIIIFENRNIDIDFSVMVEELKGNINMV